MRSNGSRLLFRPSADLDRSSNILCPCSVTVCHVMVQLDLVCHCSAAAQNGSDEKMKAGSRIFRLVDAVKTVEDVKRSASGPLYRSI